MNSVRRAIPVLHTEDPAAARAFYESLLGFVVAMEEDGMVMLRSATVPTTQVILTWRSATAADPDLERVAMAIEVADVDRAYHDACAAGIEIVRAIRDEPWGIRRFFSRDPSGAIVLVAAHTETVTGR